MPNNSNQSAPLSSHRRELTYGEAIREGLHQSMAKNSEVMVIGEGVSDPKSIFKTTDGLVETFGKDRVSDMPLAENGMTGVCIGLALNGFRPVMVHQRIDFALLAIDQLINNAAKWHYIFNGQASVPLVVRMLVGRGWGQGPQHAQSLQSLFAHIPGLSVVMPTTTHDAKGMLISAIEDNNPVIFIEHRWLYNLKGNVPQEMYRVPLDKARIIHAGRDVTIASFSYMTVEALAAAKVLANHGIHLDIIDMRSARPMDMDPVLNSVKKTGRLIVLDTGWATCGLSAEIVSRTVESAFQNLKAPPLRITLPDHSAPTANHLTNDYYPDAETIIAKVLSLLDREHQLPAEEMLQQVRRTTPNDMPNPAYVNLF